MTSEHKHDYMTREGFALATDLNNRLAEAISRLPVVALPDPPEKLSSMLMTSPEDRRQTDSAIALGVVAHHLAEPWRAASRGGPSVERAYGVTKEDMRLADKFLEIQDITASLDFTWHAAPAFAVAAVHAFEAAGRVTLEQQQQMTLHDWANIIGTGWFSRLMHSVAFARNATYADFGMSGAHFQPNALGRRLARTVPNYPLHEDMELFTVNEEWESQDGLVYTTASATTSLRKALSTSLHSDEGLTKENRRESSPGCPAARYVAYMPYQDAAKDPHVRSLINRGELSMCPVGPEGDTAKLTQEYTTIDHSLVLLAAKLDTYQDLYGTPRLDYLAFSGIGIVHDTEAKDLDLFRRPATIS